LRQNLRIALVKALAFLARRKITRRQTVEFEHEGRRFDGERATIRFGDLTRSHRQETNLEQKPPRRR
jgi:hypothetical protein